MDEALITRLLAATSLTALVGQTITYVERPEENDLPGLTIAQISPNQGGAGGRYHHGGVNDWLDPRIQFDAYGRSPLEAKQIARALIAEMEQARTVPGIAFDGALLDTETDEPPERLDGGTMVFRVRVDMLVPWRNS